MALLDLCSAFKLFAQAAALGLFVYATGSGPVAAQATDDHSAHHPAGPPAVGAAAPTIPPAASQPSAGDGHTEHHPEGAPTATAPAIMGGMGMMGRGARPLYPTLMSLPALSPEQRSAIEADARGRIGRGMDVLAHAHTQLHGAITENDAAAMARSVADMRDGVGLMESGTNALRGEGRPPGKIALDWYRGQMNLAPPGTAVTPAGGAFGLSWFHLVTMGALAAFGIVMTGLFTARMRRAAVLVERLTRPGEAIVSSPASVPGPPPQASPSRQATPVDTAPDPLAIAVPKAGRWAGRLQVAMVFDETPNVRTFRLVDPAGGGIPFSFRPGQFLDVTVDVGGTRTKRSYTIASAPTQQAYVEITIKREPAGTVSRYLHDQVARGGLLDVSAPAGTFTFTGTEAGSIVLIGGGVGITPLMSIIRYLTDRGWPGEIVLIYCARTTQDFIFRDELEALQRRHANLQIFATMTRAAGTSWVGLQGYVTRGVLEQAIPDIAKRRVHVCGPPAMMDALRETLEALGVPKAQVKSEAFAPPGAASTAVPAIPPEAAPSATPVIGPATSTVRFSVSDKTAALPPDRTVLEAAESIGVSIDNSCRSGTCGACKTKLVTGTVTMAVEDGLEPAEKAAGFILACQAKSVGNLVVEA